MYENISAFIQQNKANKNESTVKNGFGCGRCLTHISNCRNCFLLKPNFSNVCLRGSNYRNDSFSMRLYLNFISNRHSCKIKIVRFSYKHLYFICSHYASCMKSNAFVDDIRTTENKFFHILRKPFHGQKFRGWNWEFYFSVEKISFFIVVCDSLIFSLIGY